MSSDSDPFRPGSEPRSDFPSRAEFEALREQVRDLRATIERQQALIEKNEERISEHRGRLTDTAENAKLDRLAQLREETRADLLNVPDRRALTIYEHWGDLAHDTDEGRRVDTLRTSPQRNIPSRFKKRLEALTGENLTWHSTYLAMQALARLSGSTEREDEDGNLHLVGGTYEYHERTSPYVGENETFKLLLEVDPARELTDSGVSESSALHPARSSGGEGDHDV